MIKIIKSEISKITSQTHSPLETSSLPILSVDCSEFVTHIDDPMKKNLTLLCKFSPRNPLFSPRNPLFSFSVAVFPPFALFDADYWLLELADARRVANQIVWEHLWIETPSERGEIDSRLLDLINETAKRGMETASPETGKKEPASRETALTKGTTSAWRHINFLLQKDGVASKLLVEDDSRYLVRSGYLRECNLPNLQNTLDALNQEYTLRQKSLVTRFGVLAHSLLYSLRSRGHEQAIFDEYQQICDRAVSMSQGPVSMCRSAVSTMSPPVSTMSPGVFTMSPGVSIFVSILSLLTATHETVRSRTLPVDSPLKKLRVGSVPDRGGVPEGYCSAHVERDRVRANQAMRQKDQPPRRQDTAGRHAETAGDGNGRRVVMESRGGDVDVDQSPSVRRSVYVGVCMQSV